LTDISKAASWHLFLISRDGKVGAIEIPRNAGVFRGTKRSNPSLSSLESMQTSSAFGVIRLRAMSVRPWRKNPVALIIPRHRVLAAGAGLAVFGARRLGKRMLALEALQSGGGVLWSAT
jgi:hypothetical protein